MLYNVMNYMTGYVIQLKSGDCELIFTNDTSKSQFKYKLHKKRLSEYLEYFASLFSFNNNKDNIFELSTQFTPDVLNCVFNLVYSEELTVQQPLCAMGLIKRIFNFIYNGELPETTKSIGPIGFQDEYLIALDYFGCNSSVIKKELLSYINQIFVPEPWLQVCLKRIDELSHIAERYLRFDCNSFKIINAYLMVCFDVRDYFVQNDNKYVFLLCISVPSDAYGQHRIDFVNQNWMEITFKVNTLNKHVLNINIDTKSKSEIRSKIDFQITNLIDYKLEVNERIIQEELTTISFVFPNTHDSKRYLGFITVEILD